MELLDAIEEFEQSSGSPDFVERRVLHVQQQLRALWVRKHGSHDKPPRVPFYWVFSKLLRLIEAYPDGLTEAVVLTELATAWKLRYSGQEIGRKRRVRDVDEMGELLDESEQEALHAKTLSYENHRLQIEMEKVKGEAAIMYLHQRFRSCVSFLHSQMEYESGSYIPLPAWPIHLVHAGEIAGEEGRGCR